MTKPVDLESLEAKYGKATPGEWLDGETVVCVTPGEGREGIIADLYCDTMGHAQPEREANTALIVALVNAFPAMAAELRALRAVRDAAKAWQEAGDAFDIAMAERGSADRECFAVDDSYTRLRAALSETP
jgi:hypothetical protein